MQEVEPSQVAEILSSKKRLDLCDLLCFVYDTSDAKSFEYVAALRVSTRLLRWYVCKCIQTWTVVGKVQNRSYANCLGGY